MSYSTILSVKKGKSPNKIKGLRNSHGSAPVVWGALCSHYFGTPEFGFHSKIEELWPLYKDKNLPEHHRSVLMMTFDLAYVAKENFSRAAEDIRRFLEDFPVKDGYVNHWPEIASIYESNPDVESIAIYHTSVSECPFFGEWNEDEGKYDVIDWDDTYEIYESIDSE